MSTQPNAAPNKGRFCNADLSLRLPEEVKAKLYAMAEKKRRKPSDFIRMELTKIANRA